jgi:hypothetical protein
MNPLAVRRLVVATAALLLAASAALVVGEHRDTKVLDPVFSSTSRNADR